MLTELRKHQPEIEATIFERVHSVPTTADAEVDYDTRVRSAIAAALDYCLTCVERDEEVPGQVPPAVVAHARLAACRGVALDAIVLNYIAGYRIAADFVRNAAASSGVSTDHETQRTMDAVLERLVAVVSAEYRRELERVTETPTQRRRRTIEGLLAGEPRNISSLDYKLDGWHVGLIGIGAAAEKSIQGLALSLRRELLSVSADGWVVWAWLGGPGPLTSRAIEDVPPCAQCRLAIGEPAQGIHGWRRTHWQAQAALAIAIRVPKAVTRSVDVALEAALLRDEAAAASLHDGFLKPLDSLRMGGQVARETLRAYFACAGNTSSTAHRLNIRSRHTVLERLRRIEECLGRSLYTCRAELETALRLEVLGPMSPLDDAYYEYLAGGLRRYPTARLPRGETTTLVGPSPNAVL